MRKIQFVVVVWLFVLIAGLVGCGDETGNGGSASGSTPVAVLVTNTSAPEPTPTEAATVTALPSPTPTVIIISASTASTIVSPTVVLPATATQLPAATTVAPSTLSGPTPVVAPTPTPETTVVPTTPPSPTVTAMPPTATAIPTPNPANITVVAGGPDVEEQSFLQQLNAYRAANGQRSLTFDPKLFQSASWMAQDMATKNYVAHTDSQGRDIPTRIHAFGFTGSWVGENIAGGFEHAADNLTIWQSDDIHKNNLLGASYTKAGVGRYYDKASLNRWYWVLDMGS